MPVPTTHYDTEILTGVLEDFRVHNGIGLVTIRVDRGFVTVQNRY